MLKLVPLSKIQCFRLHISSNSQYYYYSSRSRNQACTSSWGRVSSTAFLVRD